MDALPIASVATRSSAGCSRRMRVRMLEVGVSVDDCWPSDPDWEALAIGAAHAALSHTPFGWLIEAEFDTEISVQLTDDAEVQKINSAYRHTDNPHNVLSFTLFDPDQIEALSLTADAQALLGALVLAAGVVARAAAEHQGTSTS